MDYAEHKRVREMPLRKAAGTTWKKQGKSNTLLAPGKN